MSPIRHDTHTGGTGTDAGTSFGKMAVLDNAILSNPAISGKKAYLIWVEQEGLLPGFIPGEEVYFMASNLNNTNTQPLSPNIDYPQQPKIIVDGSIDDLGYIRGEVFEIANHTINLESYAS